MCTMASKLSISDVNKLSDEEFEGLLGNVIELCTDAAKSVKHLRPFNSSTDIGVAFCEYLTHLSIEEKLSILKLHPDLAGRLAAQGELTKESNAEQRSAGLHTLLPAEKRLMDECNQRYKEKFGFPFIICARENKVQSIISGLQNRYHNTRVQEINTGIEEVKKICKLRIMDIVHDGLASK